MEEYIVSARKYRPASFDTVVGQRTLTTTLLNAIKTGKLAHAYLFCGPRGVGKTTCARIFAKTINCLNPKENGEACNECESCRAFDEGRSMNIHELDAASNNSVDDIRELIQQVQIPPQTGRYKVFIIDEVHMLSAAAFNAFLKTLEEPPSYVIFVMATTEKHKILPTILSRCQVYDFARMTISNTVDHLRYVAQKEGYTVEDEALNLIAQKADGGMRDALSIFDQMVSFTGGEITYAKALENLNVLDAEYYFRLVDHFLKHEVEPCILLLDEIIKKGFDPGIFIGGLASHLRNLMVSRDPQTLPLLETSDVMKQRFVEQAQRCPQKFLYRTISLCNECDQNYRSSRNKRLQVEICLIQAAQDEDASVGRRPHMLKPLFTALAAQQKGQQTVVSANTCPTTTNQPCTDSTSTSNDTITNAGIVSKPVNPSLATTQVQNSKPSSDVKMRTFRIGSFGPSINNAGGNNVVKNSNTTDNQTNSANIPVKTLNQHDVQLYWLEASKSLPIEYKHLAQRMAEIVPDVVNDTLFSVTVNNVQVRDAFMSVMPNILKHIRANFNNMLIDVRIDVAKYEEVTTIFSKPEILKHMVEVNPAIRKFQKILDLEID